MAFTAYSPRGAELDRNHFRQGRSGDRSGSSTVGRRKPRQAFLRKKLRRRYKPSGVIECERADMKMRVRRAFTFARQGGPASCAEAAQPAGRRIESGYLALGHGPSVTPECDENGNRRTAMLAAAWQWHHATAVGAPLATNRTAPQRHRPSIWLLILPSLPCGPLRPSPVSESQPSFHSGKAS
jgi:hypothetical protein